MTSNRLEVGLVSHWKLEGTRIINGESKKRCSLSVRFAREDGYFYNFNQPGVLIFKQDFMSMCSEALVCSQHKISFSEMDSCLV